MEMRARIILAIHAKNKTKKAFINLLILKEEGSKEIIPEVWDKLAVTSVARSRIALDHYRRGVGIIPVANSGQRKCKTTGQR